MNTELLARVGAAVDDRPEDGVFRVRREVFTDPALFELEMRHVFGRNWVFLGLESQVSEPHDFLSTWIATTPVLLQRDAEGRVGAFLNVCPHKGALLVPVEQGNTRVHVCPYHGWSFDTGGKNIHIKDAATGAYPSAFDAECHDLQPLARVQSYGGLVFGSLSADVPPLEDFLGDLRYFIDLAMQQGPQGMEVLPGRVAYTYRGNWKLQMDNGSDAYHLTSTHSAFMDVLAKRAGGDGYTGARQFDWQKRQQQKVGIVHFAHGHVAHWMDQAEVEKRPIYPVIDEIRERVGELKAAWMLKGRSLTLFPNMQLADQTSLNLRTFRPLAPGLTEMRVYCLAPIGEPPERRTWRLRQFEDFFNASGLATPDDATVYEAVQRGCAADGGAYLQGYYRGLGDAAPADTVAGTLGLSALASQEGGFSAAYETALHGHYREWQRLLREGLVRDGEARA